MRPPARLLLASLAALACDNSTPAGPSESGEILVAVTTLGGDPDLDGYFVVVDDGIGIALATSGQEELRLDAGDHDLELTGVAQNCEVTGGTSRRVVLQPGDDLRVSFEVRCAATGIEVRVTTGGVDLDSTGYTALIGGVARGKLPPTGILRVTRVEPGTHTVALADLAPNCAQVGEPTRTIVVANREVAPAIFHAACTATTGVVRVEVVAAGADLDDRFQASVVGTGLLAEVTGGTGFLPRVPGGNQSIHLTGVAGNCSIAGSAHQVALVPTGGSARDTVTVRFDVTCVLDRGSLSVSVTTTGTDPDQEYEAELYQWVCGEPIDIYGYPTCSKVNSVVGALGSNGSALLSARTGAYTLVLNGVEANCTVDGSAFVHGLQIELNGTHTHAFTVHCTAATRLRISAPTTGPNPDTQYRVWLWQYYYYGYYPYATDLGELAANDVMDVVLYPWLYWVELREISGNCTPLVANPTAQFNLAQGETRLVEIPVECQ